MHKFDREERVILENGTLCRVVTAIGTGKFKGKRLVAAKIYEDGRMLFRNIDCRMYAGWCISWPGVEYDEDYYNYSYVGKLEKFQETTADISGCSLEKPTDEDKAAYIGKYPGFRWVIAKSDLTNLDYFHLLPYWKRHPHEIELLLANGYTRLALDGRLWHATEATRRAVLGWLRSNREEGFSNFKLDGILCCIKYGCTYAQWYEYNIETNRYTRVDYDVYRWLKENIKRNHSLYSKLRQYRDYAKMAKEAGHDMNDRYWRFPKILKRAHDKVMRECGNIRAMKKAEELRQKGEMYAKAVSKWIGKNIVIGNGWRVYVPESTEDIVKQAEALKQCLVSCDYIGKCIKGQCVLVFVRYRDRPVATAEILPDGKLRQFYGNEANRNSCAPTKAAKEAMAAWQAKFIKNKKTKASKEAA